jgi:hypothetical protein
MKLPFKYYFSINAHTTAKEQSTKLVTSYDLKKTSY